jgi:myxalamid-type polyketide synthase MxaE and MxaD
MLEALERRAAAVPTAAPRIPLVSNVSGAPFPPGAAPDARYWRRHAREPVRFAACIDALRAAGVTTLVEIGPHPTLLALAARAAPGAAWASVASLRRGRDDRREMLAALGTLYARGAAVSWDAMDGGRASRRVSLPTYPFQRERHWVDAAFEATRAVATAGHPLLGEGRELASAPGTHVWERDIGLESHPWLRDHRVQGAAIVPATAYIELALAAAGEVMGPGSLSVQQIENLKPLILHEGLCRSVQTTLVVEPGGTARFSVHSRDASSPWTAHVTARITEIDAPRAEQDVARLALVEAARERCRNRVGGRDFYGALAAKGNQWGPCFQGMEEVWVGEGEAVGRVRVALSVADEIARYRFHPAVSDACGHSLVATVPLDAAQGATGGAFVGGGVGEVRFHRSPDATTLWTHATLRPRADGKDRVIVGDVRVYDESGALVSETLEARLWYLDDSSGGALLGAPDDWFYEVRWRPQEIGAAGVRAAQGGPWIVFADRGGVAEHIAARRAASGARTVLVTAGPRWSFAGDRATLRLSEPGDVRRLLDAVPAPAAVVHLSSMGAPDEEALTSGAESVLQLLHAILSVGESRRPRPRLWLVTGDTQAVVADDDCAAPFAAALWGLGRAVSAEHTELWGGLVDLSADLAADVAAGHLIREIETGAADDKVAFRRGGRHVARLERFRPASGASGEFAARPDGTYLVTGGLGGIGLVTARWLVERGARHLLLLGRTSLPPRSSWAVVDPATSSGRRIAAVLELEVLGARVETAALDVAIEGPLERCLGARRARGEPPVRGVIHAAGVLQFAALAKQDVASLRSVTSAKIGGAWRLHRLLGDEPLDCFVLCSSTSALLSSPLLGGYAAGNAFLDALAHHRRARGLVALSVNWGTWGEAGMAADAGKGAGGAMLSGMGTIPTSRGLAALRELLDAEQTQAAVMPVDWDELARVYPGFTADPFFAQVVRDAGERRPREGGLTLTALRAASGTERSDLLRGYLRREAARALGMPAEKLDPALPLSSFGFDSLMAVQLKNQIETDLRAVVPMILFLQAPSTDQLAPAVLQAVETNTTAEVPARATPGEWDEGSL